jgi:hypothetical protein
MHKAFRCRPLAECPSSPSAFSNGEWLLLQSRAQVDGPCAARILAKGLVMEWLAGQGQSVQPADVELLPSAAAGGGAPELHLPRGHCPPQARIHLSLSHSATHAAALLVVEDLNSTRLDEERTSLPCNGS